MAKLSAVFSLASLLFGTSLAAVATFTGINDITGTVTLTGGVLEINLDLTNVNISELPDNGACLDDGLRYHIHEMWTHNDTNDYLTSECGADYTGGHWDPWIACSSSTGNSYCEVSDTNNSCVLGSSALVGNDGNYSCNSTIFLSNPYSCEVGDWSGKYGYLDTTNYLSDRLTLTNSSAFEVSATDLVGKSVVFHCGASNNRAFCAPFQNEQDDVQERPTQTSQSKVANFSQALGEGNYIILNSNGEYQVKFNLTSLDVNVENCGSAVLYRVYNTWTTTSIQNSTVTTTTTSTEDCVGIVGQLYDPTITCAYGSEYTGKYCEAQGTTQTNQYTLSLCDNSTYKYTCNYTSQDNPQRYSCSPSDLSGKYGNLSLTQLDNNRLYNRNGSDDLLISLELLEGKSVVLQCGSQQGYKVLACAKWLDYTGSSGGNSNGGNPSNDSGDDGLSGGVIAVIVIACIIVVGVVIYFGIKRYRMKDAAYATLNDQ